MCVEKEMNASQGAEAWETEAAAYRMHKDVIYVFTCVSFTTSIVLMNELYWQRYMHHISATFDSCSISSVTLCERDMTAK